MSKNKSGSRPRELFEDMIEELEEIYNKDRVSLRMQEFPANCGANILQKISSGFSLLIERLDACICTK